MRTALTVFALFLPACFADPEAGTSGDSSESSSSDDGADASSASASSTTGGTSSGGSSAETTESGGESGQSGSPPLDVGTEESSTGDLIDPYGPCTTDDDCDGGVCWSGIVGAGPDTYSTCVPPCDGEGAECPDDPHGTGAVCSEIGALTDEWGCLRVCVEGDCMDAGSCAGWNNAEQGGDDAFNICWWYT